MAEGEHTVRVVRVVYLVSTLRRSGPVNQLYSLVRHLDRARLEVAVVALSPESADSRQADFEALGVPVFNLGLSRLAGLFMARGRLQERLDALKPDVVHSHGLRADALAGRVRLGDSVRRVATIHNYPVIDYRLTYGWPKSMMMVRWHVAAMARLDCCVGVSEAVARNLRQTHGLQRVCAIANGGEAALERPLTAAERQALRRRLGLPDSARIAVVVGHLSERKNPLFLIDRWRELAARGAEDHLVLLGDGPLRAECEHRAEDCETIHLLGRVPNVPEYLQASDYYVSASIGEGLPMAAVEALGCALPLLVSDIPPHQEIVGTATGVGCCFALGDASDFEAKRAWLLGQDPAAMGKAALELAQTSLSAAHMARQYQRVYRGEPV